MSEYLMPSLGADMEEGTVIEWGVKPGDRVRRGDIIGVVRTEKADIDIEAWEDAVVDKILARPGETLPVGAVLVVFRGEKEAAKAPAAVAAEKPAPAAPAPEVHRIHASPLAQRIAKERGIDLSQVHGTGPHGEITQADVLQGAKPEPVVPARTPSDVQAGMRRAIAAAMARSNREIPHYYLETRIDMDRAQRFLEAENQKRPIRDRLLIAVVLIKAVAKALNEVPELNGYWTDDRLQPQEAIHIGLAIALRQGGLVVPAIHDVDTKSLDELMQAMSDLITRARTGRLRGSELTDGTITITHLGDLGVETVYGVIYPPQVALVGFGRIVDSPWAENGMLGIRPVLTATIAGDHRATDGRRGAQFLTVLNRLLQEPAKL
ncbi:MAG TPA: dihydrolipoamide acetyltransferase family protein [Bryobacteraceae bacterium]|nr:dihydrolipoamide acetyltransferase family protein [Bryobacteraceae bacterium]